MQIIKTGISRPPIMLLYSQHKVGKSTFGAGCNKPLFICTEAGLEGIETDAFPLVHTFQEFEAALDAVERLPVGQFKTLVIDSLDWLERLIFRKVCQDAKGNPTDISQIGFAKGYIAAEAIWGEIIDRLTVINRNHKLTILLLAHAAVTKVQDPERDDYDMVQPDLHKRSVNLLCEFVDIISYGAMKITTVSKNDGPLKAKTTGERIMHLTPKGGFMAGNRYGLPDSLPLEWSALAAELKKKQKILPTGNLAGANEVKESIKAKIAEEKIDSKLEESLPTAKELSY